MSTEPASPEPASPEPDGSRGQELGDRPALPDQPVLPTKSSEDTDVGWGDYLEPDDDWLLRDRPPHWDR